MLLTLLSLRASIKRRIKYQDRARLDSSLQPFLEFMSESEIASSFFPVTRRKGKPEEPPHEIDYSDAALVDRVEAGEEGAFEDLYKRFAPLVNGIVIARVPYSDAEDVVQEVFISAFKYLGRLRDRNAVGPWIARIARNSAAEYFRRRRPTEELPDDIARKAAPTNEALAALEAITSLPEAYSETLTLRLVEGMTGPEIAVLTGKKEASVRVNLHRGMKMLRKKLGARGGMRK